MRIPERRFAASLAFAILASCGCTSPSGPDTGPRDAEIPGVDARLASADASLGLDAGALDGGPGDVEFPDATLADASAADVGALRCRSLGSFTRSAPLTSTSGKPFHPYGMTSDPSVLFEGGHYRMWLTSVDWTTPPWLGGVGTMGTAYLESTDGQIWDDRWIAPTLPGHQVSLVLPPGTFDSRGVETPSVLRGPDGALREYYTADLAVAENQWAIGMATSIDGLSWTRREGPVFVGQSDWEQPTCLDPPSCTVTVGGVLEPSVVWEPSSGRYLMAYAGFGPLPGELATMRIGLATSSDGLTWTPRPDPALGGGPAGAWDEQLVSHANLLAAPGGGYHLFYFGYSKAEEAECANDACSSLMPGAVGHAFSEDGVHFTREPAPVLPRRPGQFDAFLTAGPSAVLVGNQVWVFYFASDTLEHAQQLNLELAFATAPCLD